MQNTNSKDIKKISSQTWNIKLIMHQGSCHTQNIQICNNEERDQNMNNFLKTKMPKSEINQLN